MTFEHYKECAKKSIESAIEDKMIDKEILFLLDKINSLADYYTTSSCYGRIVIAESTIDNKKKSYQFLGKWHRKVTPDEVNYAIGKHKKNILSLRLDPIILHIGCKNMNSANRLLKICQKTGLKRTGIYQIIPRIIIEIIGVDSLQAPLGENGNILAGHEHIAFLIDIVNSKFFDNEKKIECLAKELSTL